jgi:hypothetical protein
MSSYLLDTTLVMDSLYGYYTRFPNVLSIAASLVTNPRRLATHQRPRSPVPFFAIGGQGSLSRASELPTHRTSAQIEHVGGCCNTCMKCLELSTIRNDHHRLWLVSTDADGAMTSRSPSELMRAGHSGHITRITSIHCSSRCLNRRGRL